MSQGKPEIVFVDPLEVCFFTHVHWSICDNHAFQAAECLKKTAVTMRLLARAERARLVLLTGAVMRPLAYDMLGLRYLLS